MLESRGWYQEQYAEQAIRFRDWNAAVWDDQWLLLNDTCVLCLSAGPCIRAASASLCLSCLNEFPNTPWHPTGSIRPKVSDLLSHEGTCSTSHW